MKLPHGYTLRHYTDVPCIMRKARQLAEDGADEGTLLLADHQLDGRGRLDKPWHSTNGGVYAALILRPEFSAKRSLELVHIAMLALGTAVSEQISPMTELHYRWPNALLISRGKVAGMFVDAAPTPFTDSSLEWLNIGFAVNMHDYPEGLGLEAASLATDGDCTPGRDRLIEDFCRYFLAAINRWAEEGFEPFQKRWQARANGFGVPADFVLGKRTLRGTPRELDEKGALIVENDYGEPVRIALADFFNLG